MTDCNYVLYWVVYVNLKRSGGITSLDLDLPILCLQ